MKTLKKALSVVMVLAVLLSLSISASAANVTSDSERNYTAYQIFTGTFTGSNGNATDDNGTLSNLAWGNGINWATALPALKENTGIGAKFASVWPAEGTPSTDNVSVQAFAQVIAGMTANDDLYALTSFLETYKQNGIDVDAKKTVDMTNGYYLFIDDNTGADGSLVNRSLLEVVGSLTLKDKVDGPKFEKNVQDVNDSTGTTRGGDTNSDGIFESNKTADYDIGDIIPYQLHATMGNSLEGFIDYEITFHDSMSKGLTLTGDITVKIGNYTVTFTENPTGTWGAASYAPSQPEGGVVTLTVTKESDGKTSLTIKVNDVFKFYSSIEDAEGADILVNYTAKLNEDAVIGNPGNPNDAWLDYDNNPNDNGSGNPTHGETPKDHNVVFTYDFDVDKIDGDAENPELTPLEGAKFALLKEVQATEVSNATNLDSLKDVPSTTTAGTYYKVGDKYYKVIENWTSGTEFYAKGLDDGNYVLVETEAPARYNKIDPIEFTLDATESSVEGDTGYTDSVNLTLTKGDDELDAKSDSTGRDTWKSGGEDATLTEGAYPEGTVHSKNANVTGTIRNNKGVELPETGGIGTTIFYVVGSVLVLAAIVVLITKRRMNGVAE